MEVGAAKQEKEVVVGGGPCCDPIQRVPTSIQSLLKRPNERLNTWEKGRGIIEENQQPGRERRRRRRRNKEDREREQLLLHAAKLCDFYHLNMR